MKHDDPVHGWLGASPDGIIESLALEEPPPNANAPDATRAAAAAGAAGPRALPPHVAAAVARGGGPLAGGGRGILEVKCPHNKGHPEGAVPPEHATWYYMPQVNADDDMVVVVVVLPQLTCPWSQACAAQRHRLTTLAYCCCTAAPHRAAPQVQGLMYIFDCEWCNLYIWTQRNGSAGGCACACACSSASTPL